MLPVEWRLVVYEKTKDQFDVVQKILNSPKVSQVVCATDAGREGELIFRYIYEAAHCAKPFRRLWISSLTPDAIRRGFEQLRPGQEYDPLADAARLRPRAASASGSYSGPGRSCSKPLRIASGVSEEIHKRRNGLAQCAASVSYTHLRAHETVLDLVCRL